MSSRAAGLRPLVFDLDGTLVDSRRDIAAAANHALEETGRPTQSVEQICLFVGNGAPFLLCSLARLIDPEISDESALAELAGPFGEYYLAHPADHGTLLPGVAELLAPNEADRPEAVQGRALCLCTNKPRPVTDRVVEAFGWGPVLASVVGAGDTLRKKPHPDPLLKVAEDLGVAPSSLVMIGDGPQDVGVGKAVGAVTIGVRGGLLPESQLEAAAPDLILPTLESLSQALLDLGL